MSKKKKKRKRQPNRRTRRKAKHKKEEASKSVEVSFSNSNDKKESLLALLMPALLAGIALFISAVCVSIPKALSFLSLGIGLVSLLGVVSPKTPIGRFARLDVVFGEGRLDWFFPSFRHGLIQLGTVGATVSFLLVFISGNFFSAILTAISTIWLSFLLLAIGFLYYLLAPKRNSNFYNEAISTSRLMFVVATTAIVVLVGTPVVAELLLKNERLDSAFELSKSALIFDDGIIGGCENVSEYREKYKLWFSVTTASNRSIFIRHGRRLEIEQFGPPDWSSETTIYAVDQPALLWLKQEFPQTNSTKIASLMKPYDGAESLVGAVENSTGQLLNSSQKKHLLKSTVDDPAVKEIYVFRELWAEFESEFDQDLVQYRRLYLERAFETAPTRVFTNANMIASSVAEPYLPRLASMAVVLRVLVMAGSILVAQGSAKLALTILMPLSILGCYYASKKLLVYNQTHDPEFDQQGTLFYTFVAFSSLALAFFTW